MLKVNYFIWLQQALGIGANVSSKLSFFGSAEEIYMASEMKLKQSGVFTAKQIERLQDTSIESSYKIISECALNGIDIITPDDSLYPEQLLEIENHPLVLYVLGDIKCLYENLPIAIVGTRNPCEKSVVVAQTLSATLSRCGFVVVSGGALGIDSAAHTGALCSGGKTVAILGNGLACEYLIENAELRKVISQNGALISESPPYKKPFKGSFPVRNRLIAALTVGTIVVEANIKSGSLITSKCAGEFSKDVFAIPRYNMGTSNQGVDELLRDGAIELKSAEDVINQYINLYGNVLTPHIDSNNVSNEEIMRDITDMNDFVDSNNLPNIDKPNNRIFKKRKLADPVSNVARIVYEYFDMEPLSINNIADGTVLPINQVMGAVTELEIFGYIELSNSAKYILKREG